MDYRIFNLLLLSIVKGLEFDNGFVLETDTKLVKDKTFVDLLLNFTEPLIVMPNMTCNERNITDEVNIINKKLNNDFEKFIHSLDLNIPRRWKFINHFCNCWGEKPWDHMGDPRLACCVDNKKDVRQLEHCTHDLTKKVHWDNLDMDPLVSMCIRVPIPYFLQIFQKNFLGNLDLSPYSRKILVVNGYKDQNDDNSDFEYHFYQSGITPYIPYNMERLLDHNLDTYQIFRVEKSSYYVNYTFTATWLDNPGFESVIVVGGMLSDEDSSPFELQNKLKLNVTSDGSPCNLQNHNLFKNFRKFVDFMSLIFHCPKRNTKTIAVSFEITTFSKRLHEIAIIRNSPKQVIKVYGQNLVHRFRDYKANGDQTLPEFPDEKFRVSETTEEATSESPEGLTILSDDQTDQSESVEVNANEEDETELEIPLSPPIKNVIPNQKDLSDDSEVLPLSPIVVDPEDYDVLTDDEDIVSNISYVDSSGYLDIDEWVALKSKLNSLINYREKRSIFRKVSNFVHYWSTLGPLTNLYNSDRMDITDHNIETISKLVENNSNMILHLDAVVKQQTELLTLDICESRNEIQLNFLELKAGLAFLEMKTKIIEIINQCRNKRLPLTIQEKFISENCLSTSCDHLISCEQIGLGLQLTKQRQLHMHLKIAIPKGNAAKVFKIVSLETPLTPRVMSNIPNVEEKSFKMITSKVLNLPEKIIISKNKILGGFNGKDDLIPFSKLLPTCLHFNGTFLSSQFCKDVEIRYEQNECVVNQITEIDLVQIISLKDSLRIFDNKNRYETRDCRKSCFIKPGWFTPDCFSWLVVNNSSEKFVTYNLSVSMQNLPNLQNDDFYRELMKNFSKLQDTTEREVFVKNIHQISKPIERNWDTIKLISLIIVSILATTIVILVAYYGVQIYFKRYRQIPIVEIKRIN